MWFVAPAAGRIDSFFFTIGSHISGSHDDSTVYFRIFKSNISAQHGPGDGTYPPACSSWGYYTNPSDVTGHVAAFSEDTPDTTWVSTVPGGVPSFPVAGENLFGFSGIPILVNPGVNGIPVGFWEDFVLQRGEPFFVAIRVGWDQDSLPKNEMSFPATNLGVSAPSRNWIFYEEPDSNYACGGVNPRPKGWTLRGDPTGTGNCAWNWWYTMRVQGDAPPRIETVSSVRNTLFSVPQIVSATIVDCYPDLPESAIVASASIEYFVNDSPGLLSSMSQGTGDSWSGTIPGQPPGSVVRYRVLAYDIHENGDASALQSYKVVDLHSPYYRCDTGYACNRLNISSTGTDIDPSQFFLSPNAYPGANAGDDGTAGPFDLGGPFIFYGDTVRYAWVGVDGAIALSKLASDTIDVNMRGVWSSAWDIPQSSRLSRGDSLEQLNLPRNFIAPYGADWVFKVDSPATVFGSILTQNTGNKFVVQWNGVGSWGGFDWQHDVDTFRLILNRDDMTVEFQYDNVGLNGYDTANLGGMQADSSRANFLNKHGYPFETRPRNGMCVRYIPILLSLKVSAGWNLLSVPTNSPNRSPDFLFPTSQNRIPRRISNCFIYGSGYQPVPPIGFINPPVGFFVKFSEGGMIPIIGFPLAIESVTVSAGWNIVGSIGTPITTNNITATGNATKGSAFFAYAQFSGYGYYTSTSIDPGRGYWIKSAGQGTLILSATSISGSKNGVEIISTSEFPPPPPDDASLADRTSNLPHEFSLEQNFPNPFNPVTVIRYQLPVVERSGASLYNVSLKIYNLLGQVVTTLVNETQEAGYKSASFDASKMPSGLYFYWLTAHRQDGVQSGQFMDVKKMLLLR